MLEDLLTENTYNFYGIIYDASFPTLEEDNFYSVTLKLIDPSLNCRTTPNDINSSIITLVIKSNMKECIPYIHKIGDIICIFNGEFFPSKKTVYLILTNKKNSSWTLFGGIENKSEFPLSSSKTNFELKDYDLKALKEVKNWMKIYFQINDSLIYSDDVKLKEKKIGEKNSSIVQIIKKFEFNEEIVYLIQDETERNVFFALKYFNFFEEGEILRINNYFCKNQMKICMNKHSNLLKVPEFTEYFKMFKNNVKNKENFLNEKFNFLMNFNDFSNDFNNINNEEENFIKLKDFNLKENQKIKELKILKIVFPEVFYLNEENYFNFSFECEDKNSDKNVILTLCDFDGEGDGFFNIKKNEIKDSNVLKEKLNVILNCGKYNKIKYETIEIFDTFTQKNIQINRIIGKYSW